MNNFGCKFSFFATVFFSYSYFPFLVQLLKSHIVVLDNIG